MKFTPVVYESGKHGERGYDLYSNLLKSRTIWIGGCIDEDLGNIISTSILYLRQTKGDITIFINSPGGYVSEGLAIYDAIKSFDGGVVNTRCIGQACSMAVPILAAGTKGNRFIYPNARVMIHQPSGGTSGRSTDIEVYANEIAHTRKLLDDILVSETKIKAKDIRNYTNSDKYIGADEAIELGIVDNKWK